MKKIFITLIMLMGFSAYSQNCKYTVNTKDEFTGKINKGIMTVLRGSLLSGSYSSLIIGFDGTDYSLSYTIMGSYYDSNRLAIPEGAKNFFKFDDGEVITVETIKGGSSSSVNSVSGGSTIVVVALKITPELLESIAKKPLSKVRIGFQADGTGIDEEISKADRSKLMKAASCMLQK